VRDFNSAEFKFSPSDKRMNVSADSGTVFVVVFFRHSVPFVLGMSPPTILTAVARA
jgi:hypothetical protein